MVLVVAEKKLFQEYIFSGYFDFTPLSKHSIIRNTDFGQMFSNT